MIPEAEIRRIAGLHGVDPRIVDLDYILGWALSALFSEGGVRHTLVFKGGTCLRKCYLPEHRFSEDLDFTALEPLASDWLEGQLRDRLGAAGEASGIDFAAAPSRFGTIRDTAGSETLEARVYYRGPLRMGGSPSAIRLQVTLEESLAFQPVPRPIHHPYSDQAPFQRLLVPCYALEEIVVEKVRALLGQRIYAVSRDLFDLHEILRQPLDLVGIGRTAPEKFRMRSVPFERGALAALEARRAEYLADWERNLLRLLPRPAAASFDDTWRTVLEFLDGLLSGVS